MLKTILVLLGMIIFTSCTAYDELPTYVPGSSEKKLKKLPAKATPPAEEELAV